MNPIVVRESWNDGTVMVGTVHLDDDSAVVTLYATERNAGHPGGVTTALVRLTPVELEELLRALLDARSDLKRSS